MTTSHLLPISRWTALTQSHLVLAKSQPKSMSLSAQKLAKTSATSHPVVIFLEGTTTNGRGLLNTNLDLSDMNASHRVHILSIKYSDQNLLWFMMMLTSLLFFVDTNLLGQLLPCCLLAASGRTSSDCFSPRPRFKHQPRLSLLKVHIPSQLPWFPL